jgi:lysophospholipase L1-like esterase
MVSGADASGRGAGVGEISSEAAISSGKRPVRSRWRSRLVRCVALALYGTVLFLGADYLYSTFLDRREEWPRGPHPVYHHALAPNFDGYDLWGEEHYRFVTNSLGFRDGQVRDVPLVPTTRRILLIGDSFTEGTGLAFEDTFAGLLQAAGMRRPDKVEFLNAGVLSYSPTLYYKKVKQLLERGLRFDELVVFSDVSDVYDEATHYFCQDDDAKYQKYCDPGERAFFNSLCRASDGSRKQPCDVIPYRYSTPGWGAWLAQHFFVTNGVRMYVKFKLQQWNGSMKQRRLAPETATGWLFSPNELEADYAPLGSAEGIARSVKNMQALADLLRQKGIPMTIVVYPWPVQLALNDRASRQVSLWREFCATRCKAFIDTFPAFFAQARAHPDWYERLFIKGDNHYSAEGNRIMFEAVKQHLL